MEYDNRNIIKSQMGSDSIFPTWETYKDLGLPTLEAMQNINQDDIKFHYSPELWHIYKCIPQKEQA